MGDVYAAKDADQQLLLDASCSQPYPNHAILWTLS